MGHIKNRIQDAYQTAKAYTSHIGETLGQVLTHEVSAKEGLVALIAGVQLVAMGCTDDYDINKEAAKAFDNNPGIEQAYEETEDKNTSEGSKKIDPKEYADALKGNCTLARFTFDSDKYIVLCGRHGIPSHLIAVSYGLTKFYDKWSLEDDNMEKSVFGSNPISAPLAEDMDSDEDSIITQSESNNFLH